MRIEITVKGNDPSYDGVDHDFERWLKRMGENAPLPGMVPVKMIGDLMIVRMHKDKKTGEGVAECVFAGNLMEVGGEPGS